MTREDFQRYLSAFNNDDFDGFSSFYAEDVDFNLGDRKRIVGRQGIIDFYRGVKQHIAEELRIIDIVLGPDGIGLHVYTKFTTFKDWPDFELWPTMNGDVREIESLVLYKFNAQDKFTRIISARFKDIERRPTSTEQHCRHPGLGPGSSFSSKLPRSWMPDQVRHDEDRPA